MYYIIIYVLSKYVRPSRCWETEILQHSVIICSLYEFMNSLKLFISSNLFMFAYLYNLCGTATSLTVEWYERSNCNG